MSNSNHSRAATAPAAEPPANGKSARLTDKDPATKVARGRLSVLQLAQELGSVSKACRQAGMDRTSFYEWKRRFQTHGLAGLKDLPPIPKSHPATTPHDMPIGPTNAPKRGKPAKNTATATTTAISHFAASRRGRSRPVISMSIA